MIRLLNLFQRVGLLRPTPPPQPARIDHDDVERITRLIVERLNEDESARGELTDAGFAPVLSFVSGLVPPAVSRARSRSAPEETEETVSHAARALMRGIVLAAETGDTADLSQQVTPDIVPPDAIDRARAALSTNLPTRATSDERAQRIVDVLNAAITETGA